MKSYSTTAPNFVRHAKNEKLCRQGSYGKIKAFNPGDGKPNKIPTIAAVNRQMKTRIEYLLPELKIVGCIGTHNKG